MYNVHQDAKMIPLSIKCNDYVLGGERLPAISVSASKDSLGLTHISIVNIDAKKAQDVSLNLKAGKYSSVKGRILTSSQLQDHNTFEAPDKIKPAPYNGATLTGNNIQLKLPPFSVVVLELK